MYIGHYGRAHRWGHWFESSTDHESIRFVSFTNLMLFLFIEQCEGGICMRYMLVSPIIFPFGRNRFD